MNEKEITINNIKFTIIPRDGSNTPEAKSARRQLISDGFDLITSDPDESGEATLEREAAAKLNISTPFFVKFEYC